MVESGAPALSGARQQSRAWRCEVAARRSPPSLDERFAAQAPYVRDYLLRDGPLYLSLMKDGGIYAWANETSEKVPSAMPEAFVLQRYREARRVPAEARPAGIVVLEDVRFDAAIPLAPRE
jgi:hypothetical protein